MDLYRIQKEAIRLTVQTNPISVTVRRTEYVPHEGGRKKETSEDGPFDILVYSKKATKKKFSDTPGSKDVGDWVGLALDDATFKASSHVTEEFDVPDIGRFQVKSATPLTMGGKVTGYLLALELISNVNF